MIGYFKVLNNSNKEVGRYKYPAFSSKQKMMLKKTPNISIYCCCNKDEDIEIELDKSNRFVTVDKMDKVSHSKSCPLYHTSMPEELWTRQTTESAIYYHVASRMATADDFAVKANEITYNRLIYPEYRLPDNYEDFNKKIITTLKYIKNANGEILYNMVLERTDLEHLEKNKEIFFYGMLEKKAVIKRVGKSRREVLIVTVVDTKGVKHSMFINKEKFNQMKTKLYKDINLVVISGFAYKKRNNSKIMQITDFTLKTISEMGILLSI